MIFFPRWAKGGELSCLILGFQDPACFIAIFYVLKRYAQEKITHIVLEKAL